MYLYEIAKYDALGTSQGRHSREVFSGRFEDVRKRFFLNCKNKQYLTLKHFNQQIW